ncbi:EAL domain-containing response regulator [Lysobacter sp. BMK333-48F3]|uniref:EAL domain-containing response regulator n=1 Tax=Lysobacter sp. BMK333-48F3 TaxID=2867962 RepID=UPI001C8BE08F|nr:EAL domain-containing response regulator [Lysobacter sp. BMK333-48F3]MBX9400884.1 EAL domain-containing response regulator [Lysobacter sp. BMK333-48F3]
MASHRSNCLKLLVVDDDPLAVEVMAIALRSIGEEAILLAHKGDDALKLAVEHEVDVLVCDLNMPGMDGVRLLGRIAELPVRPAIVLVSGEDPRVLDSSRQFAEARGLTILGTLQKPVERDSLLAALRRYPFAAGQPRPARLPARFDPGRIAQGFSRGALRLVFQPKVDLADQALVGAEALLRWIDPELGEVAASELVCAAESVGLIDELTLAVLAQAVASRKAMLARNVDIGISFNLSMHSLNNPAIVDQMVDIVTDGGDRFDRYTVEVMETHLMSEPAEVMESLIRFRLRGFRIAIDDYGVGAATMQFLMRLPSNELKIDRSFVAAAPNSAHAHVLLKSAVDLGLRLGQVVVAEGVETEAESDMVKSMGCQLGQGYFYARPMTLEELLAWRR